MPGFFKKLFGGSGANVPTEPPKTLLEKEELESIGTEDDLLKGFDAQVERNLQAQRAEQGGDVELAITLYGQSVDEEFVGAHPYERLAHLYESRGRTDDALRVTEAFIRLAGSGRLPKGSQRSADRRLPAFEARAARLRSGGQPPATGPVLPGRR